MWPRVTSIFQIMTFKESPCLHLLQYMSVAMICTMCVSMWCSCAMFCLPFPPQVNIWALAVSLLSWVMPLRASYAGLGANTPRFLPGRYWGGELLVWGLGLHDGGFLPALSFSGGGGVCYGWGIWWSLEVWGYLLSELRFLVLWQVTMATAALIKGNI